MAVKKGGLNTNLTLDEQEKAFTSGAVMQEKGNRKGVGGRPTVEQKADKGMIAYFTEEEKSKVKEFCGRQSFSSVVRNYLREQGVIE